MLMGEYPKYLISRGYLSKVIPRLLTAANECVNISSKATLYCVTRLNLKTKNGIMIESRNG